VQGAFGKGDLVLVLEPTGREIARGLCAYDASDAQRIIGLQSQGIEAALGYPGPTALIHRDDLVVPGEPLSRTANG
jgi:glutamate 5-kinase